MGKVLDSHHDPLLSGFTMISVLNPVGVLGEGNCQNEEKILALPVHCSHVFFCSVG